jgi:outer membrane protein TolC
VQLSEYLAPNVRFVDPIIVNRLVTAKASSAAVDLVEVQYRSGLTNFQNLLDMQRFLFRQEDELAVSEGQVIQNLISLYSALGGGWDADSGYGF